MRPDCLPGQTDRLHCQVPEDGLIIHDGRTSSINADFYPWCGRRPPKP
ncbi:DUF6980 family protein [Streptomyces sp. NPDC048248]